MSISDWPEGERPREKMLQRGAEALSDAELLAIFLRTGVKGKSAVDLARELLVEFNGLQSLLNADQKQFCSFHGLGKAKFAQLHATLEMGRRYLHENMVREDVINSPQATRQFLKSKLTGLSREVFAALFLDAKHRVILFKELFHGTIDGASVYPREVVRQALKYNAAALVVAHNHPSGVAEPSRADIEITRRLKESLALLDIRLLDHMVVGGHEIVSLAELGHL